MKVLLKMISLPGILVLLFVLTANCVNIFGFATDKEKDPVSKAEEEIRSGNYDKAQAELAGIIDETHDSQVIYTYAKATLLKADVNIAFLIDLVQGETKVQDGFNNPILQKIDSFDIQKQNAWYDANTKVSRLLTRIWTEQTYGELKKDDIALDYTVSTVLSTVMGLRDTNQDGVINYDEDIKLDLISIKGSEGFVLGEIKKDANNQPVLDNAGKPVNNGLVVFLGGWTPKNAAKTAVAARPQKERSPDDINTLIAFILTKLDEGEGGITLLLSMYVNPEDRKSSINYEDVKNYIVDIGKYVNYYWYDDGIDNDGDNQTDEEIIDGLDNDGDDLVDEDSRYHPSDKTDTRNTQYRQLWQIWYNR